jgi:hypothetical protein
VRTALSHGLVGRVRNFLGELDRSVIRVVHGEAAVVHTKGDVVHHAKGAVVHHAKGDRQRGPYFVNRREFA